MTPLERVLSLPIWRGCVRAQALGGGITNVNFVVEDDVQKVVVRIGDDIPVHQISRSNELAASRAAHAAGVSPAVIHHQPGALVIGFIEGRTLAAVDVRANLEPICALVARAHRDIPQHFRGPATVFWVFQVLRDYLGTLRDGNSPYLNFLPELMREAAQLETAIGAIDLVFGHNDLLPANFMDDGSRLWLIDWDYAGFNSPLFDLGGLAANNALSEAQETVMLSGYFDRAPDAVLWRKYRAMKAAAALRETLWSMVSEQHSELDFDYPAYTASNLSTYRAAFAAYQQT